MLLPLQVDILYGPVNSRRLGKSLGINLMPAAYKLCSFNCVYCQYGWTQVHTLDATPCVQDLPSLEQVVERLRLAANSALDFDYLTFSGNGEPTLYPWFAQLIPEVIRIRDRYRPKAKIALLSNSTGLVLPGVRESIAQIDCPVFKLDAGTARTWRRINRPAKGIAYDDILANLRTLPGIYIQTLLMDGMPANTGPAELQAYFERIAQIRPKEVHLYSIDRPVPASSIALVRPRRLEEIAREGEWKTGVKMRAFYRKHES